MADALNRQREVETEEFCVQHQYQGPPQSGWMKRDLMFIEQIGTVKEMAATSW